ncbi:MAG TPA: response regulator transcription factor [Candidatus Limnocylindrales bacterium]|jgi:DNA-binding NarL/FixJ family response regulator|nr:response regulator transcription factor [Candidatus Limnocylindrales bacterium]
MVAELIPGTERISVHVAASDPLSRAGISSQLRGSAVDLVEIEAVGQDVVALVIADQMDAEISRLIRSLRMRGARRVIVVATRLDDAGLLAAVEAGASGLIRRSQATPQNLIGAIRTAANGEGSLPPDLLGRLLDQVERLQHQVLHPRGLTLAGLTDREIEVLRLLSDGLDTNEVSQRLYYSERTVKNIIHDVTSRLDLRNRTHAVAYAIRQGLI